jgi:hypothetical protein
MQLSETGNFALRQIMTESAGLGTVVALVMSGNLSPNIKKADAYERFGRSQGQILRPVIKTTE